jgi:hypothetical protein
MMLGSTYALMKDMDRGAAQYRLFLEQAPNDPLAKKVQQLVEKYEETKAEPQ